MENLEKAIAEHPFWSGLDPHFFLLLNECATFLRFDDDQMIFKERTVAEHFYLIQKGQVVLETFVPGKGDVTVQCRRCMPVKHWGGPGFFLRINGSLPPAQPNPPN